MGKLRRCIILQLLAVACWSLAHKRFLKEKATQICRRSNHCGPIKFMARQAYEVRQESTVVPQQMIAAALARLGRYKVVEIAQFTGLQREDLVPRDLEPLQLTPQVLTQA